MRGFDFAGLYEVPRLHIGCTVCTGLWPHGYYSGLKGVQHCEITRVYWHKTMSRSCSTARPPRVGPRFLEFGSSLIGGRAAARPSQRRFRGGRRHGSAPCLCVACPRSWGRRTRRPAAGPSRFAAWWMICRSTPHTTRHRQAKQRRNAAYVMPAKSSASCHALWRGRNEDDTRAREPCHGKGAPSGAVGRGRHQTAWEGTPWHRGTGKQHRAWGARGDAGRCRRVRWGHGADLHVH